MRSAVMAQRRGWCSSVPPISAMLGALSSSFFVTAAAIRLSSSAAVASMRPAIASSAWLLISGASAAISLLGHAV